MARPGSRRYFANLAIFTAMVGLIGSPVFTVALAHQTASNYAYPARRPPAVTPATFGLAHEDLQLDTEDGVRLAAWYVPPPRRTTLILVHGLGANRADLLPLARAFVGRGYGLLLLDLRAHGESGGRASTLGLHEVRDVSAAVRYLQQRPEVDPDRIGIYGQSLGAAVAIMAGAELTALRAVVADSGFASVEWLVRHQFGAFSRLPAGLAPLVVEIGRWQTGVDVAQVAPVRHIGRISPRPVMIVHGELDDVMLVENALLLADAAREPKEVWIAPGVHHAGAYGADPDRYLDRVAGFLDRALR